MEIWKEVPLPEYEGMYQVSNLGRARSFKSGNWFILKPHKNQKGYFTICLWNNNKGKTRKLHQLIAITFLNHKPCGYYLVVNHKNLNKLDNHLENLEIVTQRENANLKHMPSSSKYVGVCWKKRVNKWEATIYVKGRNKYLGRFVNELDAHHAYQNALKEIEPEMIQAVVDKYGKEEVIKILNQ